MVKRHNSGRTAPSSWLKRMLRDEEGFLRRASAGELTQAVLYFRNLASRATTPQKRDFYLDRANQFSIRAMSGGEYGGSRHSRGLIFGA